MPATKIALLLTRFKRSGWQVQSEGAEKSWRRRKQRIEPGFPFNTNAHESSMA